MRILFAIPHFHDPHGDRRYASARMHWRSRLAALRETLSSIHLTFGTPQYSLDHSAKRVIRVATPEPPAVDILVCTSRDRHVLDRLSLPPGTYDHRETDVDPLYLGFECQRALGHAVGAYDYYCYVEDDLSFRDPLFLSKLRWFIGFAGPDCVLQPNRYEYDLAVAGRKLYVDGVIASRVTAPFQDRTARAVLTATCCNRQLVFRRPLNPHAGCYFLTAEQMQHWVRQSYFWDADTSFLGPLESAATLGIMRTFRVYKVDAPSMEFFEVRHATSGYIKRAAAAQ